MIKIEAWSDINCPFCYLGKRNLEEALRKFGDKDLSVEWKSFELDPAGKPAAGADNTDLLARKYGRNREWAQGMNERITSMARTMGLDFHMERVVPANSFNAHRLLHLAKSRGLQSEMKDKLLSAKFIDGKDINDPDELARLAQDVGLEQDEALDIISGDKYSQEVREDERMADSLGIHAVPFFVMNGEYALSGAQPVDTFLEVLNQVKNETRSSRF